jgi:hypothetical protein|tara:strand:+ start:369 stop:482 length:114 start_codon:yes stop_codon:yes gene_type:complete
MRTQKDDLKSDIKKLEKKILLLYNKIQDKKSILNNIK